MRGWWGKVAVMARKQPDRFNQELAALTRRVAS
jgi:hypothetical protein